MEEESKANKKRKRKTTRESQSAPALDASSNGSSDRGNDGGEKESAVAEFPVELRERAEAALIAESQSVDKGIDAWRKLVAAAPAEWAPRRELARVFKKAERWKELVDVLKDAVDKASWPSPSEKVPLLFDIVEIYRDRLKQDLMVVSTYNQILAIQPENLAAVDALAAQYEAAKKWPDLISLLRRKIALVDSAPDKIGLHLQVASLFLEKFSNQAEAIKDLEAILDLDRANPDAIASLKQLYERRRDWEKLIEVNLREVETIGDSDGRGKRLVEVARLASDKLKKPATCIDLWKKVVAEQGQSTEAWSELEKLYEREKAWESLGEALGKLAALAGDPASRVTALTKLAVLYTEKIKDPDKAIDAWRGVLAAEPENRRAQEALKKLFLQQKRWDDVEQFYAAQAKWDELVRVFERQIEVEDDATRAALWNKIGLLARDRLAKPDRAAKAFEKTLSLDPRNLEAAEALIPLYEAAKDARHLADVLRVQIGHTKAPAERQERMRRLASLLEGFDKPAGLITGLQAFSEDPSVAWARELSERLAGETSGWAQLVETYESALPALDGHGALPVLSALVRAHERELGNAELAITYCRRILESAPSDVNALAALERLYIATGRFSELLAVYEKKLELASSKEERIEVRYKLAGLYEEEIRQPERAMELYRAILETDRGQLPALHALDRMTLSQERWEDLCAVLQQEVALTRDLAALAELRFRLGAILQEKLDDPAGALDAFREALDAQPEHAGARGGLERLLGDPDRRIEAVAVLEPIYEREGDLARLVEVQQIRLAAEKDTAARVDFLLRIGELEAKRGRSEQAYEAFSRAFGEDPASADARDQLEKLAAELERWPAVIDLYERTLLSADLSPSLQRALLLAVANACSERLGQPDRAIEAFQRIQDIDPTDEAVLLALEGLYTRTERWTDLVETLKRQADRVSDPGERAALRVRVATVWEEVLGNTEEAVSTWKEVLGDDPNSFSALHALDRLYVQHGEFRELADNLQRELQLTNDKGQTVALLGRLGNLREAKLGELSAAVDTYKRVLDLEPGHVDTVAALERILPDPEQEQVVAQVLEPIYKEWGDWSRLCRVLEVKAQHTLDPAEKVAVLQQVAEGYEIGCEDPARAYDALARALKEDPRNVETKTRIERLARLLGRFEDLVRRYGDIVDGVLDEDLKREVLHKIAHLQEAELHQDALAVEAYRKAMDASPCDLEAASALERIYLRGGDYRNLVMLLQRRVEMVDSPTEKKELCLKAAQILEEILDAPDQAVELHRQILTFDEADPTALDHLERLFVRLSRWSDLKDVYAKKAELAKSPEERKQMLFVLGQVYDRELSDVDRAIETYRSILDLDPDDYEAVQALDRLYAQSKRSYDLLSVLERQAELAPSAAELVSVRFRIGELWRTELKDASRAVEAYRQVLAVDPANDQALAALDTLMRGSEEPILAAQVLEPIYETSGEWDRLVEVTEVMARYAEDPPRKVEMLGKIADLKERRLGNGKAALEAWGQALGVDSSHSGVVANLERLASATGEWSFLSSLYAGEIDKILDGRTQVEMLLRLARIFEEELSEPDRAIAVYRRIVEVEPDNQGGWAALDRLYAGANRWQELTEVLRREIRLAATDEAIVELTFRLGQIFEIALLDLPSAVECYRDILAADPAHAEARAELERLFEAGSMQVEIGQILEPLYRVGEEWDKLVRVYEVQLAKLPTGIERQNLLRRVAEISEQKLVDQVAAFEWWRKALVDDPSSELAFDELLRLARLTHQWDEFVTTMLEAASGDRDSAVRRDVLLRLGKAFEEDLQDLTRAEEVYLQVLGDNDREPLALESLDRIYGATGMTENLAAVLRQRIAAADSPSEAAGLNLRLGRVLADTLGDDQGAIAAYSEVLETESRNGEALEAIERLYFRGEDWPALFGVYEKLVDVAPGDEALAECYARMARIASEALGDRERAVDLWRRVLDLRGDDPIALGAVADLHEAAGEWREITEVLDRQVRATPDPADRIPLFKRLGRVWGGKLNRERNSLESWQKVLEIDPSDVEALYAIAANYRSAGAWEELSDTLNRLIHIGADQMEEAELKDLYSQLGDLEGESLMRTQAAIDAWRHVLELDPRDFRALAALERLFTQEARWEDCVEIIERRAQVLEIPVEQIEALMQAASIWSDKIDNGGAAAEVYERILQIEPSHAVASADLEQIYRQRGNWLKLVELLLARMEWVEEAATRTALLCGIAEIYEKRLNDRESAFVTVQAAFREDFSNEAVAKELERLATAAGKWNELIAEYTQVVSGVTDSRQAAELWVKIGRWYDTALGHLDYAIASAQQALSIDPIHVGALTALEDFFRKQARWQDLVSALSRHAEVEQDVQRRVDVLLQLADTYETQIGDPAQATLAYQRALDADERCMDATGALERLYRRTQAWDRLVEVLSKKSQIVDDGELAVKLRVQVGELWEDRLGDNDRAVEAYKDVLTVDPQNLPALKALERLYEKTGKMEAYLDNLDHQLDVVSSDDERISLYQRQAVVWEENFAKPDRAAEVLERVLLVDGRNQRAFRDLERIYRQERKWEDLVEIYRRHIGVTGDLGERTELTYRMGQVYEEDLRDPDRAVESFEEILTFEADHVQALTALARLYEQTEQWDRALEMMRRLTRAVDDPRQKVELNFGLGKILDERMKDPEAAEERFMEALGLDPAHVPSMLALLALYRRRSDWLKSAQLMLRAEAHTTSPLDKTRLLFEAAKTFEENLGDEERAAELYARTLELDPEHTAAGEPLAQIYFKRREWATLVPVIEMLLRKADKKANRDLNVLHYRIAKAFAELGDEERSLRHYKQAYDLDSTFLPTLIERAALLYKREQWDDAFKIYQTILHHHRDSQRDDDIVEIFYRLGRIKLKVGERSKAINMFEKAIEVQAAHRPTIESLVDIYTEAGDWEAVIRQKRALCATSQDIGEKFSLLEQIAELYKDRLRNPQKAIASYLEAQDLKPTAHHLLHNLLDLFSETKQWKKAVEILVKLSELEKGDQASAKKIRAKYLEAAGNICRDELHATDESVEFYNRALDEDPDNLKTFERIDKILTAKKDWKNQERNYRKMIKRIGLDTTGERKQTLIALVHALGEIYRSRLKDYQAAAETFELAVKIDPDALPRHQILGELYQVLGPEHYEKAIARYNHILQRSADFAQMLPGLKTLFRLYTETKQYDRAWCVAAGLVFLRKADSQEQQFWEQIRPKRPVRARARLTEELWQKSVYHPDEDRFISHIFATVSQAVAALKAREHKDWNLKRKDRRDLATDPLAFSKEFNYVAQLLNIATPEVFIRDDWAGEIEMANAREKALLTPSFVVGKPLLQGRTQQELAYIAAKKLTLMRPDHFVRWPSVVPTIAELKVVFLAALRLVQPGFPVKPDFAQPVGQYAEALRKMLQPQHLEQLVVIVQKFIATKAEADLHRWSNAVDCTATRAGYLACGDLDVTARLIQAEPVSVGTLEPKDKIKDLLLWSVSEEYFALREQLGLSVVGQGS